MQTKESLAKRANTGVHPHVLLMVAWVLLGVTTGIASLFASIRLIALAAGWFAFECGWDYLRFFVRTAYFNEDEDVWTDQTVRTTISYAKPIFRVWLGCLVHHVAWWECGTEGLDSTHVMLGWVQSAMILLCVTTSFFFRVSDFDYRRNYVKWIMMGTAFVLPPWHSPWYDEPLGIIQARWLLTAVLFVVQCFESKTNTTRSRHASDLVLLRISWVILVPPALLLFGVGCAIYYGTSLLKVRDESEDQRTFLPTRYVPPPVQREPPSRGPSQEGHTTIGGLNLPADFLGQSLVYNTHRELRLPNDTEWQRPIIVG